MGRNFEEDMSEDVLKGLNRQNIYDTTLTQAPKQPGIVW